MTGTCHRCACRIAAVERVGRRDACSGCGSDLHCCRNCRFYAPGRHNDCLEPQAERQVDKDAGNFCEYFGLAETRATAAATGKDARAALDALFSAGGRSAVGAEAVGGVLRKDGGAGAPPSNRGRTRP